MIKPISAQKAIANRFRIGKLFKTQKSLEMNFTSNCNLQKTHCKLILPQKITANQVHLEKSLQNDFFSKSLYKLISPQKFIINQFHLDYSLRIVFTSKKSLKINLTTKKSFKIDFTSESFLKFISLQNFISNLINSNRFHLKHHCEVITIRFLPQK